MDKIELLGLAKRLFSWMEYFKIYDNKILKAFEDHVLPLIDGTIYTLNIIDRHHKTLMINSLLSEGIFYIEDLTKKSAANLLKIPNFGKKSLEEVRKVLSERGLFLKGEGSKK